MKRTWGIVTAVGVGLLLTSCGGGGDQPEAPTTTSTETAAEPTEDESPIGSEAEVGEDAPVDVGPWGPGTFQAYAPSGGALTLEIPATEAPADVEAARARMGADPVVYIAVDVDNREGQQIVNMYQVNLYDPDGNEYTFQRAGNAVDEWFADVGVETNEEIDLYNYGIEVSNAHSDAISISQRGTLYLVGDAIPEQIADVQVYAEGAFDVTFASPVPAG